MSGLSLGPNHPAWILRIDALSDVQRVQMEDQYPILQINEEYAFDLHAWIEARAFDANSIPALKKAEFARLIESMRERGMDEPPILDLDDGWVADGNHRLQGYNHLRGELGLAICFPGFALRRYATPSDRADYHATR